MSKKSDLKKAIAQSEAELDELEKKRNRSQSALLQAFIDHKDPNETDVEYFRVYTQLINLERAHLRQLNIDLQALES